MGEAGHGHESNGDGARRKVSWKVLAAVAAFSYLTSRALRGGSWYPPLGFLVLGVVVLTVRHVRDTSMIGTGQLLRAATTVDPLIKRLARADQLSLAGEVAAAVELVDSVAMDPATRRFPLLAAHVAMKRSDFAVGQGDLATAESEAVAAVRHHEQGRNRSAHSEALEKLGKIQLLLGRNHEAHATITQAVAVGGGHMFKISRVRAELYLANLAFEQDDTAQAAEHAMTARRLAAKWHCHPQHASACDILAVVALAEDRVADAATWTAEAGRVLSGEGSALPHRVRHLIASALVSHGQGDETGALAAYLEMMQGVAELRTGWGWRNAQAYYVDLYSEHEFAAYTTAHALYQNGDQRALDAFAALLDLGSRTALRRMLRGELVARTPDDIEQDGMEEIVGLLTTLAEAEAGNSGPAGALIAEVQSASGQPGVSNGQVLRAYERLETLVSLKFRRAIDAGGDTAVADPRTYARRWNSHVLHVRLVSNGRETCVVGLWTTPDGTRRPFLHPVQGAVAVLLGDVAGIEPLRDGREPVTSPEPDTAGETESVRAEAPGWRTTPRYRHLASRDPSPWASLAGLLLPLGLLELLDDADPCGTVPKLLVVPDSSLWRVPWSALSVAPDASEGYVADRAVLAMSPSLSLMDGQQQVPRPSSGTEHRTPGRAFTFLSGVNAEGLELERAALNSAYGAGVVHARTPGQLLSLLDPGGVEFVVGVASVHGNDSPGLAHALRLDRHTTLSAARMLTLGFPRTLLINACLSAELDERRGTDPLGIPTVALCRGAETVIGGIFPLPDGKGKNPLYSHPTARILAALYQLLAEGVAPATALRTAQRRFRAEVGPVPPLLWAGLVSITTSFDT
ncbi:CHAT domain-containing protein [Streptomyces salinarius]|uniref:CHAT domain-containing protein n=1 Tax=Streptomyces TaxID=1883 RepID=UPI0032DE92F5